MRSVGTRLLPGALLGALAIIGSVGCAREEPALAPAPGYPPPGVYSPPQGYPPQGVPPQGVPPQGVPPQGYPPSSPGYPPQGQPQTPANPAGGLAGMIGAALTPFGILLQQLPQLPAQLPPLPDLSKGWPFPWPFPPPAPSGPNPAPPSWPQPGAPGDWVAIEDEVLRLTNQRRAMGALCGGKPFAPAAPLAAHPQLRQAARGHSQDMAIRGYFDHRTPEGRGPAQRAQSAGYPSTFVGENIAAGYLNPQAVVQGWMDSPGHCLNVMDARYRSLGVGYYFQTNTEMRHYWTQNFGG
jgi:uncharacterized protein YkwD